MGFAAELSVLKKKERLGGDGSGGAVFAGQIQIPSLERLVSV